MYTTAEHALNPTNELVEPDGYRQLSDTLALLEVGVATESDEETLELRRALNDSLTFVQKLLEVDDSGRPIARGADLNHAWNLATAYIKSIEAYKTAHRSSGMRWYVEGVLEALGPTVSATKITDRNVASFLKVVDCAAHETFPISDIKPTVAEAMIDAHSRLIETGHSREADKYAKLLKDPNVLAMLGDFTTPDVAAGQRFSNDDYIKRHKLLEDILGGFGITDAWACERTWSHTTKDKRYVPDVGKNLVYIAELEQAMPSGPKLLHDFYGIRGFARYPQYVLNRQLEIHGKADKPYGVVVSALDDQNGALKQPSNVYWDKQLAEHYDVRVLEAGSAPEIARRMLAMDKLYGAAQKISFAVVHAHGEHDKFYLGSIYFTQMAALSIRNRFDSSRRFFTKNPTILMMSCSTGKEQGIAQKLSRDLEATVIGPDGDSGLKNVSVVVSGNQIKLEPEYVTHKNEEDIFLTDPVAANLYDNGERITGEAYDDYFAELRERQSTENRLSKLD